MKTSTIRGKWIDDLVRAIGQHIRIETRDGLEREGRLSGIQARTIKWNGKDVDLPEDIELNGDSYDRIPLDRIASFEVL